MIVVSLIIFGIVIGLFGNLCVLQKKGLLGDVLGHSLLPGVVLSFLIFDEKSYILMFIFSLFFSFLALFSIDYLNRSRKLFSENIIAAVLSGFFGLGVVLLSVLKKSQNFAASGISDIFYGNISAVSDSDLFVIFIVSSILLCFYYISRNFLMVYSFDKDLFTGFKGNDFILRVLLNSSLIVLVTLSVNIVGIILTTGLLLIPSLSSMNLSKSFLQQEYLTSLIASLSIGLGVYLSMNINGIPTGPVIIIISFFIFMFTYLIKNYIK